MAILAVGAEVARRDAAGLLQFAALININLAVVNILPLPALDGGLRGGGRGWLCDSGVGAGRWPGSSTSTWLL